MMETGEKRKAVLIFAAGAGLDLARRKWPKSFRRLLPLPFLDAPFPDADLHLFTSPEAASALVGKPDVEVHRQLSSSFATNLRRAVDLLAERGYEQIVVVGRDCPDLSREDVAEAFRRLSSHRLVLGPDHKGGVYLIGFAASRRGLLRGIRWGKNTDCRQLRGRFGPERTFLLSVKQDLDDLNDVRRLARTGVRLRAVAEALLRLPPGPRLDLRLSWIPRSGDCQRIAWQLPPPS